MKKTSLKHALSCTLLALTFMFMACKKEHKDSISPSGELPNRHPTSGKHCHLKDIQNLKAVQDSFKLKLSWSPVEEAKEYDIYRAESETYWDSLGTSHMYDSSFSVSKTSLATDELHYTKIATCNSSTYTDYSAVAYKEYYYKVVPVSKVCEGKASEPVWGYFTITSFDSTIIAGPSQEETKVLFEQLALATGGESYTCPSSVNIQSIVNSIIQNHCTEGTDIVFLVDNTGSMYDDIDGVKASIEGLLSVLPNNCTVGAAYYRDKNVDTDWYGYSQLSSDLSITKAYVNGFMATGGGDLPESVYDGIYNTINDIQWRPNATRIIIVIGDAAPLTGASSTHSFDEVKNLCTSASVNANLYPILTKYYTVAGGTSLRTSSSKAKRVFRN